MRFLVKRTGAIGDVICATPILREIKSRDPSSLIDVQSEVGVILAGNPNINEVTRKTDSARVYDKVVDLDLAYEIRPDMHIIDAFAIAAFGSTINERWTELHYTSEDKAVVDRILEVARINPKSAILIHAARSWENRTFSSDFWTAVCQKMAVNFPSLVLLGGKDDVPVGPSNAVTSLVGRLSINQTAYLMSESLCLVGSDSSLLHVAGTTNIPIVGLFTTAKSDYRLPFRNGCLGYRTVALIPSIECYGCLHRMPPPAIYADCDRGDRFCLSQIRPEDVVRAVAELIDLCF